MNNLSHDPSIKQAYIEDPLCHGVASLELAKDILDTGALYRTKEFEKINFPILISHGTDDKLTSFEASKKFFSDIPSTHKTFFPVENGFHERKFF